MPCPQFNSDSSYCIFVSGKRLYELYVPCSQDTALDDKRYRSAKTMHHKALCKGSEPWFEFLGLFVFQKQRHWIASWKLYSSADFLKNTAQVWSKGSQVCKPFDKPNECLHFQSKPQTKCICTGWHLAMEIFFFFSPVLAKFSSMPWDWTFKAGILMFLLKKMPADTHTKKKPLHPNKIFICICKTPNKKQFCILV